LHKIFFVAVAVLIALTALTGTTFAKRSYRPVGVIIVDSAETKLNNYFNTVEGLLNPKSRARFFVGKDMQFQYQKYLIGFGKAESNEVESHELTRDEMIEFTRLSGCTKVLFLVNSNAVDGDKTSLKVDAYLCTSDGVQETFTASETLDNPRERRSAFRKCLTEIVKTLNQIL